LRKSYFDHSVKSKKNIKRTKQKYNPDIKAEGYINDFCIDHIY
jgi:hypothetical protein